jgi:hypothetical protein
MARAANRSDEYEFLYKVSSESLHANVHEVGRMVWGHPTSMVLTIAHAQLAVIDSDLVITYGTWLFGK